MISVLVWLPTATHRNNGATAVRVTGRLAVEVATRQWRVARARRRAAPDRPLAAQCIHAHDHARHPRTTSPTKRSSVHAQASAAPPRGGPRRHPLPAHLVKPLVPRSPLIPAPRPPAARIEAHVARAVAPAHVGGARVMRAGYRSSTAPQRRRAWGCNARRATWALSLALEPGKAR